MVCPIAYDLAVDASPAGGFTVSRGYGFPGDTGELRTATVFLSRRKGALLLRLDGGPFELLGADLTLSYRTPDGDSRNESLSLSVPGGAILDGAGRYFEQYSVQKTTSLALLVAGMHQAADLYMDQREESLRVMTSTAEQFASDAAALIVQNPQDRNDLERELKLAQDMLQLMQEGARQGTLYGP